MSGSVTSVVLMSLLAGCSTTLGASCVFFIHAGPVDRNTMAFFLSLAAGVMLSVSILEMLPHIYHSDSSMNSSFIFASTGAILYWLISHCIPHFSPSLLYDEETVGFGSQKPSAEAANRARAWRLAVVLMISLTAHNIPEGLAVAVSAMTNVRLGLIVMVAIMVHNIPEGIAIAIPAYAAHGSKWKAMMLASASGFSEPLGAIIAVTCLKNVSEVALSYALAFVAGMMCAVAIIELIPEAWQQDRPTYFWSGLGCGLLLMISTNMIV